MAPQALAMRVDSAQSLPCSSPVIRPDRKASPAPLMALVGSIAIGVILGAIIVAAVVADQYRQRNRRG